MRQIGLVAIATILWTASAASQQATQPTVRIVEPDEGAYVTGPTTIRVQLTPAAGTTIVRVRFYVDDVELGSLEEPPWEFPWDAGGDFARRVIRVVAEDSAGQSGEDTVLTRDLENAVFRAEVDAVLLYVSVVDDRGVFVPNLTREDFEVLEDGRQQEIFSFQAEPRPMVVGLLIDTSGSMEGVKMERAKQGAIAFLDQIGAEDEAFVMAFDAFPRVMQDLTANRQLLRGAIMEMQPRGATSLNLAIVESADILADRPERRALVILSDGFDTVQSVTERQAIEYAQRQDVRVYTIGIFDSFRRLPRAGGGFDNINRGEVTLRAFADGTGGRSIILESLGDLGRAYAEIAAELRSQYAIAYRSDNPPDPGVWREIEVEARGGEARTKPGYYGQ